MYEVQLTYVAPPAMACMFQRRPTRKAGDPSNGLRPMEAAWAKGQTIMDYEPVEPETPIDYSKAPNLELDNLRRTQPRVSQYKSPFTTINTSRHEVPSEYQRAREAGWRTFSLDRAVSTNDDDSATLADTVTTIDPYTGEQVTYTNYNRVDPTTEFRIDSERRSAYSGPLLKTGLTPNKAGDGVWVKTTGVPYNRRVRLERLNGQWVYVFDAQEFTRVHYQMLEKKYLEWLSTFMPAGTTLTTKHLPDHAKATRAIRRGRPHRILHSQDMDPFRFRQSDPEMEAPYEEPDVEITDAQALKLYGRPLDLCYPEEIAELTDMVLERMKDRGETIPMIRHLRGHASWAEAQSTQLHSGDYLASAPDIIG